MTILWPIHVLRPQSVAFDIAPRSLAGPSSVSGFSQVVATDAGIWKARLGGVIVNRRPHVLAWRAIDNLLEGRLGKILIPLCRGYQPRGSADLYEEVEHSDDALFSDDSGYVGMVIDVVAATNAAARAVSMTVAVAGGAVIEPGQHFSVGERLYRVRTFDAATGAMTIRPPLREAVTAGDRLEFDNPICRMRLASDQEMNLELAGRRFGSPTINLIEDL